MTSPVPPVDGGAPPVPSAPSGDRGRGWAHWFDPGTKRGTLFYAVGGGLVVRLLVDFLPNHVTIVIH